MPRIKDTKHLIEDRGHSTPCWIWQGAKNGEYGRTFHLGRRMYAHRIAWESVNGPVPDGLCVLHACDIPSCVNPAHLFLGTRPENSADMVRKNRQQIGECHPLAKLTERQVIEIRASEECASVLARAFGVSAQNICGIRSRRTWKHV